MRPKSRPRWSTEAIDDQAGQRRAARRGRGRPTKFGRPGRVVALTLPDDVIRALQRVDADAGWAIVKLLERAPRREARRPALPDVELIRIGARRSLIVVNRAVFRTLPGVSIIPITEARAFLALDAGRGMSDLELAVIDRLADRTLSSRERRALGELRTHLIAWRRDRGMQFHTQAIIVLERMRGGSAGAGRGAAARPNG